MNIKSFLLHIIHQAFISIKLEPFINLVHVQQSTKTTFGDYQVNGLITIAKKINIPVIELAKTLIKFCNLNNVAHTINIDPPGFINIFLKSSWVKNQINDMFSKPRLGITPVQQKTVVIDYSGPNVAKEMHVGHLRSTIIGDSIVRTLSFLGHKVIRANHIGDWGTQFGMIIAYITNHAQLESLFKKTISLTTLESFYQKAKKQYDTDPNFAKLSRNYIVKLQQGNKYYHRIWQYLVNISVLNNQKIYIRLNTTLKNSDIMGESAYNHLLPGIIADLKNKGLAIISNGAVVVFLDKSCDKYGNPFGVIIQKQDGAYLYSTIDIACIKYRCEILQANRIIYYTDSRQKQHLTQVYKIASKAGYINNTVSLEHHICGMLLNKNGKPFTTRSGDALKLQALLDEALIRARNLIIQKKSNLKNTEINKLAHIISISAIKYSELSKNRTTNYIFDWDHMINFEGNTAPYIQYAYTRILSIFRYFKKSDWQLYKNIIQLNTSEELKLAIHLLQFEETIHTVANKGTPHLLCYYLYKLSVLFSSFYENCPIRNIYDIYTQYSRLKLALLTARVLKIGLNLLGIKTIKHM